VYESEDGDLLPLAVINYQNKFVFTAGEEDEI
jgi:hypothetical protein